MYCSLLESLLWVAICKPYFERCFCKIKVYFGTVICVRFNITSVHWIRRKALILQQAVFSRSAVAIILIVRWNNWWHVTYATVAYLHRVIIKNLMQPVDFGNCCFNDLRNVLLIFLLTFREKEGLNEIILHLRCVLLLLSLILTFGMKTRGLLNPSFLMLENILVLPFEKSLS